MYWKNKVNLKHICPVSHPLKISSYIIRSPPSPSMKSTLTWIGSLSNEKVSPNALTKRARRSYATMFEHNKEIFFILMTMTWFKVEEFRLELPPYPFIHICPSSSTMSVLINRFIPLTFCLCFSFSRHVTSRVWHGLWRKHVPIRTYKCRSTSWLINNMSYIIFEKAIQFHETFHGLKVTNWNRDADEGNWQTHRCSILNIASLTCTLMDVFDIILNRRSPWGKKT